jgi:hypothetical protein
MLGFFVSCRCDNSSMADWDIDTPPAARPARGSDASVPVAPVTPVVKTARPRRRSWLLLITASVMLLAAGVVAGFYLGRLQSGDEAAALAETRREMAELQSALSQSEQRNSDYYRALQTLQAENETLRAQLQGPETGGEGSTSTTGAEASVLGVTYGDGIYVVGEDIMPGTYDGEVTAGTGYWARLRATDGSVGSIVANAIVRGPFVLTIIEADKAVELRGVEITPR